MDQTTAPEAAKSGGDQRAEMPRLDLGSNQSLWRLWLARVVVFSVTFVLLMTLFSGLAGIVEKFFMMLYTD